MSAVLECEAVTFGYDSTPVLRECSLAVEEGAFVVVVGPSGAGKSTLLRLFCRLEEPSAGVIRYRGEPLASYPPTLLRREVHYLQQTPVLVEGSVRYNLLLPFTFAQNRGMSPPPDEALLALLEELLLSGVSLGDRADALSVGQRQRLCLIRSLLLKPRVLLLDEPVSALDPESREVVEARAERLNLDLGLTVVMISHQEFVPHRVRPNVLEVRGGRAAYRG